MAFSLEEQAKLGAIYAPILFLSRNDVAPVSPAEFVRRSALWAYPGPLDGPFGAGQDKQSWKPPTDELTPGMLSASESDPDIAQRTLIWTHMEDDPAPAYFLDHGGWDDLNQTETQPLPDVGEVTETSTNLMGSVAAAVGRWNHRDPHPQLDPHIGWYSVQAFDTAGDLQQLFQKLSAQQDPATDTVMDIISGLSRPSWLIFFHFFFPGCSEVVTQCELIQTLHALGMGAGGVELDAPKGAFPSIQTVALGFPYALQWAGWVGQFVSIAVVVPALIGDTPSKLLSPLEAEDDQFLQPLFIGFGRAAAAVEPTSSGPPVEVPLMHIASTEEVLLDGNHVRVFVSEANHNTYPQPGTFSRPEDETRVSICNWANSFPSPGDPGVNNQATPKQAKIAVLLKYLTLGILAAFISSLAEAANKHSGENPGLPTLPTPLAPKDVAESDPEGLILAPADLVESFQDESARVRPWAGPPDQRVFDERWETPDLTWGPPALQDPFRRRQGRPMARYIGPLISALGSFVEEHS